MAYRLELKVCGKRWNQQGDQVEVVFPTSKQKTKLYDPACQVPERHHFGQIGMHDVPRKAPLDSAMGK